MQAPQVQTPAPQQAVNPPSWKTWHTEADVPQRRQLINHIFKLFSARKPNAAKEWDEKLPDFVRRLEEALYRTAASKEEYADLTTLEARLQNVARRMVARTNPGAGTSGRPPAGPGFPGMGMPQQNGNGFMATYGQPSNFNSSGQMLQQNGSGQVPGVQSSGLQQTSSATTSAAQPSQTLGSAGSGSFNQGSNGGQMLGTSAALPLSSPALIKMDGSEQQLSMGPLQGQPGMPWNQGNAAPSSGTGPVMSNGAPVLLRNSRDAWMPGQPTTMNTGASTQAGSRMLINGMAPGQLSSAAQPSQQGGVPQLNPQQQNSPALRGMGNGGGMMQLHNGMIPIPGQGSQQMMQGMVPVMHQNQGMSQGLQGPGMGMMNSGMGSMGSMGHPGSSAGSPSLSGMSQMPGQSSTASQQMMPGMNPMDPNNAAGQHDAEFVAKQEARRQYIAKQQRWLLFLRHCAKCQAPEGQCQYGSSCTVSKALWRHILTCADPQCDYPRCVSSRELLKHHQKCTSSNCPVCTPVKHYVQRQRMAMQRKQSEMQQGLHAQGMAGMQHPHMLAHGMPQGQMHPHMMANGHPQNLLHPMNGMRGGAEPPAKRQKSVVMLENKGTSLVEAFSMEEIQVHLQQLRLTTALAQGLKVPNLAMFEFEDDNACKACGETRLTFEPPSVYCTSCGQRIKRNQVYYCTPLKKSEVKGYWCHPCYTEHKGDRIDLDGTLIRKLELEKRKNDEEMEEGWVQCDQCECWVHQICGLFNKGRNDDEAPYVCPMCLLDGLETGKRRPIQVRPQAMLEARDLPRCELSDFLQARLDASLERERAERARARGLQPEQVETVDNLVVRVINNVSKKMEVKPKFFESFRNDGYPEAFPYRQKVIVLFQRIDGVDVCLYCLYAQEYGEDCPMPNKRWVYLSYLDSVKYFRPEMLETVGRGCALRTFVYHEILVGYLQYIKEHGFTSMFIWACPPLQGDDYILYCHPGKQKTPRSDRLREWYHALIRIAKEEGIVTYVSNLFDTFFEGGKDHRIAKPSIMHLPYLEGDYWPGEAENLLANMTEEQRQAGKKGKKAGKVRTKATAKGKRYGSGPTTTDEQLMGRLGEVIQGMKDDFIVVHLQEPCSFCREYISGGERHYHPAPPSRTVKNERTFEGISLDTPGQSSQRVTAMSRFQLCPKCYEAEVSAAAENGGKSKGLPSGIALSDLQSQKVEPIPPVVDNNPDLASEFFDTRQAFLSLCQGNHYQFDSLRRAKHSSMMVLYHLHNPDAPAFACTCNHCSCEIEPGAGFRCSICTDFDLCAVCRHNPMVGPMHPHPLVPHARKIDETRTRMTEEERRERAQSLQRTMNLLVHASACSNPTCPSSNCSKVKALFQHAVSCTRKVTGGCPLCRRMWALLQLHAKQCQAASCPVPRCRELREMRRRQMARQEEKRRHAYQAMLRQQAIARQQQAQQGGLSQQQALSQPSSSLF
ncbi:hypothetical protein WJX72_011411 [[Myrmecia] bisecta]|uniref:histone acetyltransferase n=1 Tax=[Myrmecia] bisecta TaxID=41462 RepID=A0AAW1QSZ2_9CHLO